MEITNIVEQQYGGRLRLRVCGLCFSDDRLLLIKHRGLGEAGIFWAPPGGGMEFGSSARENLIREFHEETGLLIEVEDFLFVYEYLKPPLHTIELFFKVKIMSGSLQTGTDPESTLGAQLIQDVSFLNWQQIKAKPAGQLHQILKYSSSPEDLKSKRGYYKFSV